ncbi:hypothetical protein BDW42DRAFT_188850 [Aspergillus taichungensis]|uniref:HhH-GPD domain-containing protein n=1 Tax=Aspergillus taichungensis TaxID=482145 RepID=A0A2J5HGR5_9EURO|nr:hypothetical protein BDW42DRAFT_188850 [Aspergillus taichungensis]
MPLAAARYSLHRQRLDFPAPVKPPRLRLPKISPYFPSASAALESCLPFPPIDEPSFGLVQEQLAHDPFRLLIATIFLNRTRGAVALPVLFQVFDQFPTIESMATANPASLVSMIRCLGFQNQRAKKCIGLAQTWLAHPPSRDRRYRKLHYPCKTDGRDVGQEECVDYDDPRVAWEIAHLPGVGAYSLDSWRIFCRDELRGRATDWKGRNAAEDSFVPEWKTVLPQDKELRAYLTWMWLKEGWVWDHHTGQRTPASEKTMRAARLGGIAHEEDGNWVLQTSPVKKPLFPSTSLESFHVMFLPLRLNDRDRDRDRQRKSSSSSTSSRTKSRKHHSIHGRPSRSSTKEHDPDDPTGRSSTPSTSASKFRKKRRSSMPDVDNAGAGTASFLESRTSLPYPTFSKAHSKEAVSRPGIPTPDPTDLTARSKDDAKEERPRRSDNHHAPPSPPLTSTDQHSRKSSSVGGKENKVTEEKTKDGKTKIRIRTDANRSSSSLRAKKDDGTKSSTTARADTPTKSKSRNSTKSKIFEDPKRPSSRTATPPRSPAPVRDAGLESANGSDATINATYRRKHKSPEKPPSRTQNRSSMSNRPTSRPAVDIAGDYSRPPTATSTFDAPPPPPPPPEMPVTIPRVDYLLQHGGLNRRVPKTLLMGADAPDPPPYHNFQPQLAAASIFDPFTRLLDDFHHVMAKNGSLAVATGYRSVARRLLDRLEAVFARDISSESCRCLMCEHNGMEEPPTGVSWGEVLELVSGRRELPGWPPFTMTTPVDGADLSGDEHIPMQKMDIDVPEQYREHYMRQSRKTKVAVDKWLNEQTGQGSSAPDGVDDETLTFAMLTHLGAEQRPLFCSLLGINSATPTPRPDGEPRPRPPLLVSSSLAIQRLYRLASLPRDPETAIYMLNNPGIHHVIATLAAISDDEWDILISGRFDGFLRSGAEDTFVPSHGSPRWGNSRANTPFTTGGISRGPTPNHMDGSFRSASQPLGSSSSPAASGGPIVLDEEQEIAALAEIERDIYLGMEALEDAFEVLHCKAESVRLALRQRGAGLSVANQNRRGSYVEARMGTPASALNGWESGTEDDLFDDAYSLAPDDSASNISSSRRRRPKRRTERRTPAPVEEEDEGDEGLYDRRDRRRR